MKFSHVLKVLVLLVISILNVILLLRTDNLIKDIKINKEYLLYIFIFTNTIAYCIITFISFINIIMKCWCECFQDLLECLLGITCIKPLFTFLYYIALILFLCTGGYFTYLYIEDPQEIQLITKNKDINIMVYSQVIGAFVVFFLHIISYFEKDCKYTRNRDHLLINDQRDINI